MTDAMPLRVMVQDAWDEVTLHLPASTTVAELKARALALTHVPHDPAGYEVKHRGAAIRDETRSIGATGLPSNAALIVLPRRRRPVR